MGTAIIRVLAVSLAGHDETDRQFEQANSRKRFG
jgi:hypothetical protein